MSSADDLESVLVDISKRLEELEWPKSQVTNPHLMLLLRDVRLMRPGDS